MLHNLPANSIINKVADNLGLFSAYTHTKGLKRHTFSEIASMQETNGAFWLIPSFKKYQIRDDGRNIFARMVSRSCMASKNTT